MTDNKHTSLAKNDNRTAVRQELTGCHFVRPAHVEGAMLSDNKVDPVQRRNHEKTKA